MEVDREGAGLTRRVALFVALMTVEMPIGEFLRNVRRFDRGGGPSGPRLRGGGRFDLASRSPLWRLEIVFGKFLQVVLYRVFLLGGGLRRNGVGVALGELLFLDLDGNVHVGLGELPLVRRWVRGRHVDVTAGIRTGFAFSHRFPSDHRKRVECSERTESLTWTRLGGTST